MAPSVGFDLDLTLIDTAPGFAATLEALGDELGVALPVEQMVRRLGPPLDQLLGPHLDAARIPSAVERFRVLYVDHAVSAVPVVPGAHEALAAVHAAGARTVVVTGKYEPNARRHLDHLALAVDALHGEVWGAGKAVALRAEGAVAYVGDHVHDVEGALAAGALSVAVLTGGCSRQELLEAGAEVVLGSVGDVPGWFEQWWPGR